MQKKSYLCAPNYGMKIIGFIYHEGQSEVVLKADSCLLNGRKPLFMPEWTQELGVTECMILRVSRLGKEIAPKFASRYYDAMAPGADFIALDIARAAKESGRPWTKALDFDYSLAIGEFVEPSAISIQPSDYVLSPEEAISEASRLMTIRQGDLIYIQRRQAPRPVHKEDIIRTEIDGEEKLYCKIK
jgi:2-keto-4-pentenoate hydratase/2-oxohepta-3-ene-1,7-dioic acid hydratase in catechol pathway